MRIFLYSFTLQQKPIKWCLEGSLEPKYFQVTLVIKKKKNLFTLPASEKHT